MAEGSSEAFAAVFRWLGIEAQPPRLQRAHTRAGKQAYDRRRVLPAKVTVGDFLRVIEMPGFKPARTAFLMPTAEGPCRFGQYAPFLKKVLREAGYATSSCCRPQARMATLIWARLPTPSYAPVGGRWSPLTRSTARCLRPVL